MSWSVSSHGSVAVLSYSNPPENQVTLAALRELQESLHEIGADAGVRLVVLASGLPGRYLGHADPTEIVAIARGDALAEPFDRWLWGPLALEALPQPVLAAVNGSAYGGASELSLACTFRVGTPDASFTQHEITRGAMPGAGATQRLPRIIGPSRAARLLMTGETIDAEEALRLGLLDAVLPEGGFLDRVLEWAEPIAASSRASLTAIKRAMVEGRYMGPIEALAHEQRLFREVVSGWPA